MSTTRTLTGARPTGALHLGHYAAIVQPMLAAAEAGQRISFVIADLHALTTHAERTRQTRIGDAALVLAAQVLASGVDPSSVRLVRQSAVPELSQAYAIVQSLLPHAGLTRMASYRAMSEDVASPTLGLLGYPVMEAADAIALEADVVLVGEHNLAHVEAAQAIVHRIRELTGHELTIPRPLVGGANLVGLDGERKMSKSLGNDVGLLLDRSAVIHRLRASSLLTERTTARDRLLAMLDVDGEQGSDGIATGIGDWVDAYRARTEALLDDRDALLERIASDSEDARTHAARSTARLLDAMSLVATR